MKKKFSWLVVFLSVLLTQLAFAAEAPPQSNPPHVSASKAAPAQHFYRCTGADGRATYTDSPCPGEGERIKRSDPATTKKGESQRTKRFGSASWVPPECQRWQDEMDLRIEMQSMKSVAPTAPAYMIWLQDQIEACKRRQLGIVDVPKKRSDGGWEPPPSGRIPDPIDNSHLYNNPPRLPAPDGAKNERNRSKADNPPPSFWDSRSKNWLPPVRNQNPFGSCVAHAAIGAAESNAISQGFASANNIDLSEMFVAWFVYGDNRPGKSFLTQQYV